MKKIAILGSTGSIGTQTLEIVRTNKDIEVTALAAGRNIDLLERQIREFRPKLAAVWSEELAAELKTRVKDLPVEVLSGMDPGHGHRGDDRHPADHRGHPGGQGHRPGQ